MGFHDVRLPETFAQGSAFGPGYRTQIQELDSMAEHRIQRAPDAGRRTYNITRGIASLDDLYELLEFYIARGGAENSFRHKDWSDYATTESGRVSPDGDDVVSHDDEDLVLVSGTTYQFVKRYVSGGTTVVRSLKKLVAGTVLVGDATGLRNSGFSLDLNNGQVTFSVGPTGTATGGCEFDVPVRFDEQTDRALQISIHAPGSGELPSEIQLVEDVDPVIVSQDFPFGGAYDHGDIAADVNISELNGRVQRFAPTTAGKSAILPVTTNLPTGAPYFFVYNAGTQSVAIKNSGGSTIVTLTAGSSRILVLALDAGGKVWLAF